MFDLVWFWPLKPCVRPIVSLKQCHNPSPSPTLQWWERWKKRRDQSEKTGRSMATIKNRGGRTTRKRGERGRTRKRASPICQIAECFRYRLKCCFYPQSVSFFFLSLKLFSQSLSFWLCFSLLSCLFSLLHLCRIVEASASPCLPTTKAAGNNLLFLSPLLCLLWFPVFLLMGLISKTQSHIPARSN